MKSGDVRKRIQSIYALSFGLPVLIMLVIFVIRGVYPFGDRSFLYSDMYHQYMPFFSEFLRKIRAGEGLAYSYNVGIGSNFLALYVYYLASPLHWLGFLLPESFLMEFMSYLVIVKMGLCGVSIAHYLRKHFGREDVGIVLFAVFYAMSGFMAAYNWNIMWLDCVILLPLIILGLERLVADGKCAMYCVMLALSIFTNYYISIMICLFVVLYFAVLLVTKKCNFKVIGNFAVYSLLAGGMASVLLIPEVCAIIATDFGEMSFREDVSAYFSVLDVLARHCMCVPAERGLEYWPNIYCGVAVFLLIPMYALNRRISIRRRFCKLALAGFMLLGFSTNLLDFIWHGLNYPDSLPGRQAFIYIFLILIMSYEAYMHIQEAEEKHILYSYLGTVVFLLFCEKFVENQDFFWGLEWLTLGFVSIYAIFLYLYRTRTGYQLRFVLVWLAILAVVTESSINIVSTGGGTVSRSAYLNPLADYQALYQWTEEREEAPYRLEKFIRKTKNDSTLAGFPSASVFSSTMNSSVKDMYKKLGMRHSKVYYGYDGATPFTAALLNVKYIFGDSDKYTGPLYELVEHSGEVYLYEGKYSIPFGYVAPVAYDFPEEYTGNTVQLQNKLVRQLGIKGELLKGVRESKAGDDVKFTAEVSGTYYARMTHSGTTRAEAVGGILELQEFTDLKADGLLYLGYLNEGETMTLTNADEKDETPEISAEVYRLNEEVLAQAIEKLLERHLTAVEYDTTHLTGRLALTEAGRVILSIPYEKGWTVYINGEETVPETFGGALIALDLEAGDYELVMEYHPRGSIAGWIVSLVSVAVFGVLLWVGMKQRSMEKGLAHE